MNWCPVCGCLTDDHDPAAFHPEQRNVQPGTERENQEEYQ